MKTVKVKIAVAIDPTGSWNAAGWKCDDPQDMMDIAVDCVADGEARYWIEAELPVPETATIQGAVTKAAEF